MVHERSVNLPPPPPETPRRVRTESDAIESAFDRYSRSLYHYVVARTGGNADLADDVMQQVWLQAVREGGSVPIEEMEFWLRRVATNALRAHWRKQRGRPPHVPVPQPRLAKELAQRLDSQPLPDDELDRRDVRDQLLLAITTLTASDQELIIGRYFHGRSLAQLAESLGIGHRAVEGRLYRARQALKDELRQL